MGTYFSLIYYVSLTFKEFVKTLNSLVKSPLNVLLRYLKFAVDSVKLVYFITVYKNDIYQSETSSNLILYE